MKRLLQAGILALVCVASACGDPPPDAENNDSIAPELVSTLPAQNAAEVSVSGSIVLTFSEAMDTASLQVSSSPASALGAATWTSEDKVATLAPSSPLAFATAYSLTIDAKDLAGNALPTGTLAFVTAAEPDTTAPTIASTIPPTGARGIATSANVSVTFSEPMDAATVTLELEPASTLGEPTWDAAFTTVSVQAASLAESTTYTVVVSGKDVSGNALAGEDSFSFTTGDFTAPTITETVPAEGAVVGAATTLSVTFSEPMDASALTVVPSPTASIGSPAWSADKKTVSFAPEAPLSFETAYAVAIGGKDVAGNDLTATTLTFSVGPQPTVVSTSPGHEATGVGTQERLEIVFSQAMDTASVQVVASAGGSAYELGSPTWSNDLKTVRFAAPPSPFAFSTSYTVSVEGSDTLGNELDTTEFSFTVTARPAVSSTIPANNATGVDVNGLVTFTFNVPMDRASVEGAFSVTPAFTCAWAWSADSKMVSCKPLAALSYGTRYTATLAASAHGTTGDAMAAAHAFAFTTASAPDTTPPTVTAILPHDTAGYVRRNAPISITFSEQMDPVSTQTAFTITAPAGMMGGTFSWNTAGTIMSYKPPTDFAHGDRVSWTLSTLAEDKNRNRLAAPYSAAFRVVKLGNFTLAPVATAGVKGSVSSAGEISAGEIQNPSSLRVGDTSTNAYWRAFVTFDLATIPYQLVAIVDAKLKVNFTYDINQPAGLGKLYAQSVNYGPDLSFADFDVPTDKKPCTTQVCLPDWYRYELLYGLASRLVNVTDKVNYDLTKTDRQKRSQFRVTFATYTDNDRLADMLYVRPELIVDYEYAW